MDSYLESGYGLSNDTNISLLTSPCPFMGVENKTILLKFVFSTNFKRYNSAAQFLGSTTSSGNIVQARAQKAAVK